MVEVMVVVVVVLGMVMVVMYIIPLGLVRGMVSIHFWTCTRISFLRSSVGKEYQIGL